jgi:signal peptidase I
MPNWKTINYLLLALLVAFIMGNFRTYMVMGESDLPTFENGDKVIINRSAYDMTIPFTSLKFLPWKAPSRGDMILCYLQKKDNGDFWLKRIIGLPGDTIRIKGNKITINSIPLKYEILKKESMYRGHMEDLGDIIAIETGLGLEHIVSFSETENIISNSGPLVVADDHYFVLGDNRFNSLDSRFLGQVPRQNIFGKYMFRIYKNN